MFMQQVPNPAAGRLVVLLEWLRTRMSAPSKTRDWYITVFAFGGIISSPGAPYTVTLPGRLFFVRYSAIAIAAAKPIGPWVLCWSPWKSPLVPRSASYSTMTPRFGGPLFFVYRATKAVESPGFPT